jgi:two-component system, cell cycle response regulator
MPHGRSNAPAENRAANRLLSPGDDPGAGRVDVRAASLRILVVDDSAVDRCLLGRILQDEGHEVAVADDGQQALRLARRTCPQMILTDWMMPRLSGVELCAALRGSPELAHTYVIVMTAQEDNDKLVQAFAAGADDYLVKPVDRRILSARLQAAQRLIGLRERVEQDREEIRRYAAQLAALNRKLSHLALHDQLTGLGNRRCAMELLDREWDKVVRYGMPLACLLVDIDSFKQINDTHGHAVGDAVLRETAQVLKAAVRASDAVCRFGGEEFLVVCPEADARTVQLIGDRLRAAVAANRVAVPPDEGRVTVSVGAACRTPEVGSLAALLKLADEALYAAKNAGRDRVCVV